MFLLALIALALNARDASGVIVYRIGTPFSETEKDSLEGIGIDFREFDWSENSQLEDALDPDSLQAGVLQPNFFDEDEDIAATLLSRDGWVAVQREAGRGNFDQTVGNLLVDQDPSTAHTWKAIDQATLDFRAACCNDPGASLRVHFDLGGRFLIREVRLRTLADRSDHFLEQFVIGVSDERYGIIGNVPNLPTVVEVEGNTEPEVSVMLDRPVTTNFVQLRILRQTPKEIGLAAFELYGGGYVRKASYESDVIELDDIASLGEIRWSGRQDPHAQVAIRTRAGTDPHPVIFWETRPEQQDIVRFLQGGGDLSLTEYKRQYDKLADFLKPEDEQDRVRPDTEHWSFYSSPYAFEHPGIPIASPGPRKFVQIRVDFASTTVAEGGQDRLPRVQGVGPAVGSPLGRGDSPNRDRGGQSDSIYVLHQSDDPVHRQQF